MASLTIVRSSEYANRIRKIDILLDDKKIGDISNGESKTFDIPGGQHSLKAKVDWCSSNLVNFDIPGEGSKSFSLTSFAKHNPFGIFATIYYITLGSKKYLNLKEL